MMTATALAGTNAVSDKNGGDEVPMYDDCVCVMVMINEDNGNPSGYVHAVTIGDEVAGDYLELDSYEIPSQVECKITTGTLRVREGRFPIRAHKRFVGNILWDAVFVTPETAAEIANYIRKMKTKDGKEWAFWCDSWTDDGLVGKWESFAPFTPDDFEDAKGFVA